MAKLLIIEPHCSGHRMQYVRWLARGAVAEGYEVQLATFPQSLEHPLYAVMQEECQNKIQPVFLPNRDDVARETLLNQSGVSGLVKRELNYHKLYSDFFKGLPYEERPNFVFLPYFDYLAYAVALLGSPFGKTPWGGVVMRPSFHLEPMGIPGPRSKLDWPKKKLFFRLLRNRTLRALFSIDEPLVHYVQQARPALSHRLAFLPDPAELRGSQPRESARRMFGIPGEAKVILVYGSLTPRKGIEHLLLATQEGNFPSDVHLLLAGRQDPAVKKRLCWHQVDSLRESRRLHEYDNFLSDEEEYAAFRASDMVWMGYSGHYLMSGVLVQAGMMSLPVVACSEGVIGWLTRTHRLGLTVGIDVSSNVAGEIAALTNSNETSAAYGENGRRFAASHTPAAFYETVISKLRATSVST